MRRRCERSNRTADCNLNRTLTERAGRSWSPATGSMTPTESNGNLLAPPLPLLSVPWQSVCAMANASVPGHKGFVVRSVAERFASFVRPGEPDECWVGTGYL